jgi:hypothetical protein
VSGDPPTPRARAGVPDWDDEYVDRVADRLMHSYDLACETDVRGEVFDLSGEMRIERQKQLFHPSINYANHSSEEHLFARRTAGVRRTDLDSIIDLGHTLAEEWIETDETHFSTDFTFVLIVPEITDAVREFVAGFRDRTLLKLGFHGHYEVNLAVVAPENEDIVTSKNADVGEAFALWSDPEPEGLFTRLVSRLRS